MRTAILLPRASKPPFDVLNRKGCGAVGRRYRHAPPGYQQGYVANTKRGRGVGGVLRELQAAIPNLASMNRACSTAAPLSNNRTCPLRVMCIASYPWIVRQAPSANDKVQNDGREGRGRTRRNSHHWCENYKNSVATSERWAVASHE